MACLACSLACPVWARIQSGGADQLPRHTTPAHPPAKYTIALIYTNTLRTRGGRTWRLEYGACRSKCILFETFSQLNALSPPHLTFSRQT